MKHYDEMLKPQPTSETKPAVVYNHTVKSFLRHVLERRGHLNAKVTAELGRLGLDVARPSDMPIDAWWKVLALSVRLVAGDREQDAAWEMMGGEVMRGFAETLVGKSAFLVLRLLGPRRALRRLTEQYRTADSVTTVESRELDPTSIELVYTVVGGIPQPSYVKGILKAGMELVGARDTKVSWSHDEQTPGAWRYVVSWAARS